MSETILTIALAYAQIALGLSGALVGVRTLFGPRAQDRVLALDALYVAIMLLLLVTGMQLGTAFFFEAATVIAMTGFVTSVALAKFLFRGEVIE